MFVRSNLDIGEIFIWKFFLCFSAGKGTKSNLDRGGGQNWFLEDNKFFPSLSFTHE